MGLKAWVRSSTDQLHNIAVQGPKSRDILQGGDLDAAGAAELEELGWFRFTIGRIGGYDGAPVVVSRTGYTGELGYEIFCHPKDAATVFDAVWEAGRAARADAARAAGARHAAHRGGADLRRLRVLRPDRSVRGRHRLHRAARTRRTTISSAATR